VLRRLVAAHPRHGVAGLTEVGQALEFVQTPLQEARRKASRGWSHVGVKCVKYLRGEGVKAAGAMAVGLG
jgi:hypothetical protein